MSDRPFLRADATPLRDKDIKLIISTRGKVPNAAALLAKKYRVSTRRIYQIWNNKGEKKKPVGATLKKGSKSRSAAASKASRSTKSAKSKKTGGSEKTTRTSDEDDASSVGSATSSATRSSRSGDGGGGGQSTDDLLAKAEDLFAR